MPSAPLVAAHRLLQEATVELTMASTPGTDADELLSVLTMCEAAVRVLERVSVAAIADLQRRGMFAERGYRSAVTALADLLGWERSEARRRLAVAEQAVERTGLDGARLPARLSATAAVFAAGMCSARHVEIVARVLDGPAARRLPPDVWAAAEAQLAAKAGDYSAADLHAWATALVETLDQDGPEPDDRPPVPVNELLLTRNPDGAGGRLKARIDDPTMYDAIVTVLDAHARPATADDDRPDAQRKAEALADVCAFVLDHGDVPARGGERPHLTVAVRLEDLENRARAACLDLGGPLSPEQLRLLCCDARVVPVVLGGAGQPLDVGRARRVIPDGLRRAIAARDRGCARCGRPPSWCEIHHVVPWESGGPTSIDNCAMLCRACHRLVHHGGWDVRLRDGLPEFRPPRWIDRGRRPRSRPPRAPIRFRAPATRSPSARMFADA
ncbi:HNH endonuclease [Pseudonocardia sp. D17]|uniref:HNH endonuclease n=1 Tax=Pseudonocardia sp. D17 TaxID=882661 RepID=UPI0030CC33FD|nr:HNH endonuclease [Pseudonocardia sp. D17]